MATVNSLNKKLTIHDSEKDQVIKLFTQEHVDRIDDRLKVLEAFLKTEQHVTVDDLTRILNNDKNSLDLAFVHETLKLMCHFGFAQQNRFDNGQIRYEHRHLGQHHDHMICTKCQNIIEFQDEALERLQIKVAMEYGFHMLQHKMEIYGVCSQCQKEHQKLISLTTAKPGERLRIKKITGGAGAKLRLISMGLKLGDEIEVITNQGEGQMVIASDFTRYVLGKGLAQKIIVELID